jgi:hypothetical protein
MKQVLKHISFGFAIAALSVTCAHANMPKIKELKAGEYNYVMDMENPGMPIKVPQQKFKQCLLQKDIDEGKGLQAQKNAGVDCKYSDVKTTGNNYKFKAACTMQGGMKMNADYDVTATGNDMKIITNTVMEGANIPPAMAKSKTTLTMTRVGDCK